MFEVIEHTADVGLRIEAPEFDALFEEAGRALFSLLIPNTAVVRAVQQVEFAVAFEAPDDLLVDWLSELLFTFESRKLVLCSFNVTIEPSGLRAVTKGEPLDLERHEVGYEIKAVTYHRLKVERQSQGWAAQVFLDL
jgi:SHS2 domain-containing protein